MQSAINKEIRHYEEDVFMGLSLRQLLCSACAVGTATGVYFLLRNPLGQEIAGWVCMACAAPLAAAGFFTYDGLTFEKFLRAVWRACFLCAKPRVWRSENHYEKKITRKQKRKLWRKNKGDKPHEIE